jgi:hypothetical protein
MSLLCASEAATNPPLSQLSLVIVVPGVPGAQWTIDVIPHPRGKLTTLRDTRYTFDPTPTAFARKLHGQRNRDGVYDPPVVRCIDIFDAICTHLSTSGCRADYSACGRSRQFMVTDAYSERCEVYEDRKGVTRVYRDGSGDSNLDKLVQNKLAQGLKKIDFMAGRTKCVVFAGLDSVLCVTYGSTLLCVGGMASGIAVTISGRSSWLTQPGNAVAATYTHDDPINEESFQ